MTTTSKPTFLAILKAGAIAGGIAAVINAVLFFISQTAGIITDTIFVQPDTPLTIVPVLVSSIMPLLLASAVYFLIAKYTEKGYRNFSILAVVLLVFSFGGPFSIPEVTIPYALVLNVMHLVAVTVLLNRFKTVS
tara:strand:- start:272 stop:676 length:405 start_codon:yes stop_codon:yes gene_type:complete